MARFLQLKLWKNISTTTVHMAKKKHFRELRESTPNNPGVNLRLRAISQEEKGLPTNFEDDIDDFELDVMNADKAFDDHEREIKRQKHVQAMKIVERKYFKKAKEPNMVFWEEKEQMRYLHNNNPEEWDVARLSESFPVSQTAVKKILKANWSPQDRERILKYNESVKRNWKLLGDGKLDIDEKLKTHLMKFMSREKAQLPSSDSLSALNPGTLPPKQLCRGGDKIADTGRLNATKLKKEPHQDQQHKNKSELPGTYKIGDSHYDSDDGEFLFRVPGMNS
ncbi:neugrin [Schistocerca nitens]|uniref:neugrin n=1 Tax=Schistocerca nitens TaxID=7011 RepID=UPI0021175F47|nr:neugrin [Schistocerca nitens]